MDQAMALVRRELGSRAVILTTRQYKRGGVLGIGAQPVVELVAADGADIGRRQAEKRPEPIKPSTAGDLIKRTYQAARADIEKQQPKQTVVHDDAGSSLADEIRAVKSLVESMVEQQRLNASQQDLPDKLFDQYMGLLKQEVTEELAAEIIGQVREQLTAEQLEDADQVRAAVRDSVAQLIPTTSEQGELTPTDDGRSRTIMLVGPTGVGKTTTIAKLAATFKLKRGKNVGLITLDTYRIAAVEQLRTYAQIIGVPLHVATNIEELHAALRKTAGCDVVFIDTAGRSQKDDPRLQELRSFIEAADPHEVHLVLSSTCTQSVMMEAIDRFSAVRADRMIFTKLDEAVSFGVVLNVARKVNKQLSYITTGQEVPHQIEASRPDRLAKLVLGEGV